MELLVELNLVGAEVTQINLGFEFVLLLWPEASIQVGGPFTISERGAGVISFASPEEVLGNPEAVASLFRRHLTKAIISDSNELNLEFSDGMSVAVPPSQGIEAFGLNLPGSPSKIVCIAGGTLEIWD